MKALIKLYANQYGLAFFSFPFFFFFKKKPVLGSSCKTDATMRTFSNAVIQKNLRFKEK